MIAPYGSWKSPITAELIVTSSIGLSQPALNDGDVYWLEVRPAEAGRYVVVRRRPNGHTEDVNPPPLNARTRVHEYGGGDYAVHGDTVYFANFTDQRLYVANPGFEPVPLTHGDGLRYADPLVDAARDRLICVREDHGAGGEPQNTIAAVDLATGDETVLASGHDFYAYPRLSPDGSRLAWIAWDHPNMPWDGTLLYLAPLDSAGLPIDAPVIAGSPDESVLQPAWSPTGDLYYISDASGWCNLYRVAASSLPQAPIPDKPAMPSGADSAPAIAPTPVCPLDAEFAKPLWQLGASSYGFDGDGNVVCYYGRRGSWRLARIDAAGGALADIDTPFTDMAGLKVEGDRAVFLAGSPVLRTQLVSLDLTTGAFETLRSSSHLEVDSGYVSEPESIEFPTEDGLTAFAFFYPPRNQDYAAPEGEKPPLLVMSHGGPTGATSPVFSPRIQYWTSRGIAVLDVNYGGSTGYGRDYRRRLNGRWGIVDVDDCVNGARYLVQRGDVDPDRLAITGGSAGGFTTLSALTFRDVFRAGASHYGVADLEALARDTHKFESRYLDNLVGPYPAARDLYVERSPIHSVDLLNCPVIFFQGLEDRIVPPNQTETMVAALRAKGVPVAYFPFENEQHGFRRAENIKRALEAEYLFYARIFAYEPADEIEGFEVENL